MTTSPVIEEIHAFRAEYARQYNYDLKAICNAVQQKQRQSGHEIVSFFVPNQASDSGWRQASESSGQIAATADKNSELTTVSVN